MRIDPSEQYYLGSWRRSPFDAGMMPQSLNVTDDSGQLRLSNMDAPFGNLWKFNPVSGDGAFTLSMCNSRLHQHPMYITHKLRLSAEPTEAAVWEFVPHAPFRNGPGDVSFQLRLRGSGQILCSSERTGEVMLMDTSDAERQRDRDGNFIVNIAWEGTVDSDDGVGGDVLDVPDWLQEMLLA